ncbi:uncharacterized protein N7515_007001 [Penicillium bovifimosum]|uniref:Uncharacterized protein n=1 Tax=Penicillium bovifimosum TaxID=126998 RepID=A0A9W9GVR3_9EURO|nr:uncharacterized protein N7515_007001 [Penicillium bovifimosum]KAJ5130962.1 hypothetical protein N7515_007001 [Penicillium bovifimosum]
MCPNDGLGDGEAMSRGLSSLGGNFSNEHGFTRTVEGTKHESKVAGWKGRWDKGDARITPYM